MKTSKLILTLATIVGLSGCAHQVLRGSVAMKTSDDEAHVCLGKGEVKEGDRVSLFKNVCVGTDASIYAHGKILASGGGCEKKAIGQGTVRTIINDHYSVVKFDPGVQFEEGTIVERQ